MSSRPFYIAAMRWGSAQKGNAMSLILESVLDPQRRAEADAADAADKDRAFAHYTAQAALARKPSQPHMIAAWLARIPAENLLPEAQLLARELALLYGHGHIPLSGCHITMLSIGDAMVPVEYEYEPGEPAQTSGPPEDCYEGSPETMNIIGVFINGLWCDPIDFASEKQIKRWEQAILEERADATLALDLDDATDGYRRL